MAAGTAKIPTPPAHVLFSIILELGFFCQMRVLKPFELKIDNMIAGSWDDEWVLVREEGLELGELAVALPGSSDERASWGSSARQLVQSNGVTYIMYLSEGQSRCKCGKPKGYLELKLKGMHSSQDPTLVCDGPSKWCFACCCADCHKWTITENYGGEANEVLLSRGWSKSKKCWRCPNCA